MTSSWGSYPSEQPMSWLHGETLDIHIYDYLLKRGWKKAAFQLFYEANLPLFMHPVMETPLGALYEWWITTACSFFGVQNVADPGHTTVDDLQILADESLSKWSRNSLGILRPSDYNLLDFGPHSVPSPMQARIVRELIQDNMKALEQANEKVTLITKTLEGIEWHQDQLQKDIDLKKAYLAPVRCLPFELLGEIFEHLVSTDSSVFAATTVAAVCRTWRLAALGHPRIWRKLHIRKALGGLRLGLSRPEDIVEWVGRSGACALDIKLHLDSFPPWQRRGVIEVVQNCNSRWGTMEVISIDMKEDAALLFGVPTPRLQSLRMTALSPSGRNTRPTTITPQEVGSAFPFAPVLQELVVQNPVGIPLLVGGVNADPVEPSVYRHLSALTLGGWRVEEIVSVLRQCWRLEKLRVHRLRVGLTSTTVTITQLPQLLELEIAEENIGLDLLRQLHAPALHMLHITGSSGRKRSTSMTVRTALTAFLERHPTIRVLECSQVNTFNEADLVSCLKAGAKLEVLRLTNATAGFIKILGRPTARGGPWLCPALHTLHLLCSPRVLYSSLVKLKALRQEGGCAELTEMNASD